MKFRYFWTILLMLFPLSSFAQDTDAPGSPSLYVPEPSFQFETVVSGQGVTHDYTVQNIGTAPLEITSVKTG